MNLKPWFVSKVVIILYLVHLPSYLLLSIQFFSHITFRLKFTSKINYYKHTFCCRWTCLFLVLFRLSNDKFFSSDVERLLESILESSDIKKFRCDQNSDFMIELTIIQLWLFGFSLFSLDIIEFQFSWAWINLAYHNLALA